MQVTGGIAFLVDDADRDYNGYPNTVQRNVRDVPCCIFFVICCLLVGYMQTTFDIKGNIWRYEGFTDYNGKFCGISKFLVDKPYLYFCKDTRDTFVLDKTTMARRDRTCVSQCGEIDIPACPGGQKSVPYPTEKYAGLLCLPTERAERKIVRELFLVDPDVGIFLVGISLSRAWLAIVYSTIVSIVLAFLYLCIASQVTKTMVMIGLFTICTGGTTFGLFLMYAADHYGADGIQGTGDEKVSFILGALVLCVSFSTFWVGTTWNNSLSSSIACIEAGAECIWDSPSIVIEPFLHLSMKLLVLMLSTVGALRLMESLERDREEYAGGISERVAMHYTVWERFMLGFHIFVSVWLLEVTHCISYFATSYASQLWFFAPYDHASQSKVGVAFGACTGYSVAFWYSMGTIVYGAFCNNVFRAPRMFLGMIFYSMQTNPNFCVASIGRCFFCFSNHWDSFLKYMTPYAFMDTSLTGSSFCKAAYFATTTMDHQAVAFFSKHSASWLVTFVAHMFISVTGGVLTYYMCTTGDFMMTPGMENPQSDFYIPRPSLVGLLSAGICWFAAHPFLVLPGYVSDNLLFCFAIECERRSMMQGVVPASFFAYLTPCAGRETAEHQAGSTGAQPPATSSLLKEACVDEARVDMGVGCM